MPSYDLFAMDLDGTLLDSSGQISDVNLRALDDLRAAGVTLLPCTGRGLLESRHILEKFGHEGPVVTAGGAITADTRTGETISRFAMRADLVAESVELCHEAGHAALVLKDVHAAGFDYLVLSGDADHAINPVTTWWFEEMNVTARFTRSLAGDDHPEQTVRVSVCADSEESLPLLERMRAALGERAALHSFPAVTTEEYISREIHILEIFDAATSKWSAIERYAELHGFDTARVAAIGDQINDVQMIEGAALGIAMGNAIAEVKSLADREAPPNDADGVAFAINNILAGEW